MPATTKKGKFIRQWIKDHPEEYAAAMKKAALTNSIKAEFDSYVNPFQGKHHTEETKQKVREKAKLRTGEKNNIYGTCWVTNGVENKRIWKTELQDWLKENKEWRQGRVFDAEFAKKVSSTSEGRVYITNGVDSKKVYPEEIKTWKRKGWRLGRW
jgi:hypothetical protein